MSEWLSAGLIILGSLFTLLAAIGVLRMPDIYLRLQATTKASTLGVCSIVLAASIHFDALGSSTRALLIIAFLLLSAPVSAHLIARAAYASDTPLWEGNQFDELRTQGMPRNGLTDAADEGPHAEQSAGKSS